MTPSALTPAARGTAKRSKTDGSSRPSTSRSSGHRAGLRREVSPRAPRRVSGPSGGAATIARPAVAPRTAPSRTAPSRTKPSRSAPSRTRTLRSRVRPAVKAPWRVRSTAYLRALPDHALLDRIIRGRAWIPILGVLLVGIVAMQVEVLKLNAGMGRSLERASALQSQNELLRAGVARLSDVQRIERIAAGMGMVMPAPDQMRFVRGGATSVEAALTSIKVPNTTSFLAGLPTIGAPAAAQGTSTNTAVGTAPTTATGTAGTAAAAAGAATGAVASASTPATSTASVASATGTPAASTGAPVTSTGAPTQSTSAASTPASAAAGTSATAPVTSSASSTSQSSPSATGGATPIGG
jgi:hypothetical protein